MESRAVLCYNIRDTDKRPKMNQVTIKGNVLPMHITSNSEKETEAAGAALARTLKPGDVVALRGGIGAGKTAFVRGLASGLHISGRVTSPTFAIVNEYEGAIPLFHFDMYRLGGPEELFDIGWDDYLQRGGICAVEWSENIERALPSQSVIVSLVRTGDNRREITIQTEKE